MKQKGCGEISVYANAKVNLCLSVLSVRPDGYHGLDMLMQSVGLSDTLILSQSDAISLALSAEEPIPCDHRNLAYRAALLLQAACRVRRGVSIRLVKRIPSGAGLGGGSADAAAVLFGLNRLWGLGLSDEALQELAVSLGADVPFCLVGGLARARGIGEKLTPLRRVPSVPLVIVKPRSGLSTALVFSAYDAMADKPENPSIDAALKALATGKTRALSEACANALMPPAVRLLPEIAQCMQTLEASGAYFAQMTGSGSAVFGLFSDYETAKSARDRCLQRWAQTYLTQTADSGVGVL